MISDSERLLREQMTCTQRQIDALGTAPDMTQLVTKRELAISNGLAIASLVSLALLFVVGIVWQSFSNSILLKSLKEHMNTLTLQRISVDTLHQLLPI